MNNIPNFSKKQLYSHLISRFPDADKKLSQIPSPSLLYDAEKAAKKIVDTIHNNKRITIVGDYDVDGVSSSAIMQSFFAQIPYPVSIIIPNRFEDGYGVSSKILEKIDADLIITVDNGITAFEAAQICKEKGIDLIITDHHTPAEKLPDAYAIVDPKLSQCQYPFKEICGAQVAWLLLGLVKKELALKIDMKQFLDILAIAIIADVMPLIDINRTLVKEGLKVLQFSNRPASIVIRDFLNKPYISSEDIAFMIAPRLNSAGRLLDASIALEFFSAVNTYTAYEKFEFLGRLNEERKETEMQTTEEALSQVDENAKVIVVWGEDWHEGVVGIVASRLVDRFGVPAIVLSVKDGVAKGSARSIGNVDIYKLIKENESLLEKFGGHKMAAGLSLNIENLDTFKTQINQNARKIDDKEFLPQTEVIATLSLEDLDFELLEMLKLFEPYGEANPRPLFLLQDAEIVSVKLMGKDKSHSRIEVKKGTTSFSTLTFIAFREVFEIPQNKKFSCTYSVSENIFNNKISLQLLVNRIL